MRIILDTDIGDDIDDSYSLGYILKTVPNDLKFVLTAHGNTKIRAAIAASQLTRSGYENIMLGMGLQYPEMREPYMTKFCDFDINNYKNFYENGIDKALEIIKEDPENTVIIALGPAGNIAEMIKREPDLMRKIRVYAMFGSVKKGYYGSDTPDREYNVFANTEASKIMISGLGNLYLAPLDTCGLLHIEKEDFDKFKNSQDKIVKAFMDDYRNWMTLGFFKETDRTSCLYDTQPVYMYLDGSDLIYETYKLKVDDEGNTVIADDGNEVFCAMSWKSGFGKYLTNLADIYSK